MLKVIIVITSLAKYIVSFLLKYDAIIEENVDIYIYGFEIIVSSSINILIAMGIGLAFSQFFESIVFLVAFVNLRKYCGGYHAKTYLKCNIIFTINIIVVMIILKLLIFLPFSMHIITNVLFILTFSLFAPIKNEYKPISKKSEKKYKVIAVLLGVFFFSASTVLYFINFYYCVVIDTAMLSVAISMIIEKQKKRAEVLIKFKSFIKLLHWHPKH